MKNAELNEYKTVAVRYAQALLELCESHNVPKNEILKDLEDVNSSLKGSIELVSIMKTPGISKTEKQAIIEKIFDNKINKITKNFLLYLIEKDRFNIIESILAEFQAVINKENNFLEIKIVSAINLTDEIKDNIKNGLSNKFQKKIDVEWTINPDIIAGLIFIVGDSIIDTSVKSKLQMIGRNIIK